MPNLLSRFNKNVIGSDDRIYDYLSRIDSIGDFKRVRNIDVIISSWNNILLTPKRSYLHDPNYGSNLLKLIFDPVDDTTVDRIKNEVLESITIYDNRAIIKDIEVLLKSTRKGFQVNILVEYQGETKELSVSFDDTLLSKQRGS